MGRVITIPKKLMPYEAQLSHLWETHGVSAREVRSREEIKAALDERAYYQCSRCFQLLKGWH